MRRSCPYQRSTWSGRTSWSFHHLRPPVPLGSSRKKLHWDSIQEEELRNRFPWDLALHKGFPPTPQRTRFPFFSKDQDPWSVWWAPLYRPLRQFRWVRNCEDFRLPTKESNHHSHFYLREELAYLRPLYFLRGGGNQGKRPPTPRRPLARPRFWELDQTRECRPLPYFILGAKSPLWLLHCVHHPLGPLVPLLCPRAIPRPPRLLRVSHLGRDQT